MCLGVEEELMYGATQLFTAIPAVEIHRRRLWDIWEYNMGSIIYTVRH